MGLDNDCDDIDDRPEPDEALGWALVVGHGI